MKHACMYIISTLSLSLSLYCHTIDMHVHAFHICICPNKSSNKTKNIHRSQKGNGSEKIQIFDLWNR